jgi:hypothetical protein
LSIATNDKTLPQRVSLAVATDQTHRGSLFTDRRVVSALTLLAYSGLVLVAVSRHEPWADEAHAWVLSRDLSYRYLVFHQLAYEGHPPLWATILWIANHWFHLPYYALGWIGAVCAIAGCWFFCRYSPFPVWIRVLFPFTYFMAFQYAVVARPYVLLPLFTFAAAHTFGDADLHPWKFVAATSALALLCAPGTMIALGLMAARAWYVFRSWSDLSRDLRKQLIAAALVFAIVLLLVAFINWPPADRTNVQSVREPGETTVGFAFLPRDISLAFLGFLFPSVALLALTGAWCACRGQLLSFGLPLALVFWFFVKFYGNLWHCGALTLILITALWIGWSLSGKCPPRLWSGVNALLLVGFGALLCVQIYWTARTVGMDYSRPYSGSLDAANYLQSVGATRDSICGLGFHSVALQPYFPHNIYTNWPDGESFWRFEKGNRSGEKCVDPIWAVLPICCGADEKRNFPEKDRHIRSWGYIPVHFSPGSLFFEGQEAEPTEFVIYRRVQ